MAVLEFVLGYRYDRVNVVIITIMVHNLWSEMIAYVCDLVGFQVRPAQLCESQ